MKTAHSLLCCGVSALVVCSTNALTMHSPAAAEAGSAWDTIRTNWFYRGKQPALIGVVTSPDGTACEPSWNPDRKTVYRTRITFSFTENGQRHYREACVSAGGISFRPIEAPASQNGQQGGTQ